MFWTSAYRQAVVAAGDINTTLATLWTGYLEDWTDARLSWWTTVQGNYLTWIADRNLEETTYQATVTAARSLQASNSFRTRIVCPSEFKVNGLDRQIFSTTGHLDWLSAGSRRKASKA